MKFNLNLTPSYLTEIKDAVNRVIDNGQYILGPEVEAFEKAFAAWQGDVDSDGDSIEAVGVGNGTDAIRIALMAVGVKAGDEVISPAFNVGYTGLAVTSLGAENVFVDVDPETLLMTPKSRVSGGDAKATIPVHMFGRLCDVDGILTAGVEECKLMMNTWVVEDAAQAFGAFDFHGRPAGSYGDVACWSFYPTKNLGCIGDGGMITSSNTDVVYRARKLRRSGQDNRYVHELAGINSCLDEIQAAILRVKLSHANVDLDRRRYLAKLYDNLLWDYGAIQNSGLIEFLPPWKDYDGCHLYVIRVKNGLRQDLHEYLKKEFNIPTLFHYPLTVPEQPCFGGMGEGEAKEKFPNAFAASREVLSLPLHSGLRDIEVQCVVRGIQQWCKKRSRWGL